MPEDYTGEVAKTLHEKKAHAGEDRGHERSEILLEVFEAALLALVAIATAWSGYQAARWEGEEARFYAQATAERVEGATQEGLGGESLLLNTTTFNTWIAAEAAGHEEVARLYVRRFSPEYREAFDAWLRTDPLNNPDAPPGPAAMPEYHNPYMERAEAYNERADATFEHASEARHIGDDYIRNTVLLATVLFLAAVASRFRVRKVRLALLGLGTVLLVVGMYAILTFPRL